MRAAPPVSVRGNGGQVWHTVQALLPALSAAAVVFWGLSLTESIFSLEPGFAALAVVAGLAVGALAWRQSGRNAAQLSWGGQLWSLDVAVDRQPAVQGQLEVMVDLGSFMLLRLSPVTGTRCWIAITAREAGAQWHGLRAAAYARVPPQAADPDQSRGTAADLRPTEVAR